MRIFVPIVTALSLTAGAPALAAPPTATPSAHATPTTAAAAPTSAAPAVGDKVFDNTGAELGVIEAIDSGNSVLTVEGQRVALPPSAFARTPTGLSVNMTKANLVAAAKSAAAAQSAAAPPASSPAGSK